MGGREGECNTKVPFNPPWEEKWLLLLPFFQDQPFLDLLSRRTFNARGSLSLFYSSSSSSFFPFLKGTPVWQEEGGGGGGEMEGRARVRAWQPVAKAEEADAWKGEGEGGRKNHPTDEKVQIYVITIRYSIPKHI